MFEDGLHNTVDIFFLNRNLSNRTAKGSIKVSDAPDMKNVPCRIIKDEKVLFSGGLKLKDGYTIKDRDSGTVYEVRSGSKISGIGDTHHTSYKIRIKTESGKHGRDAD